MMENENIKRALLNSLWTTVPLIVAFVASIFIAVIITGFEWTWIYNTFKILGPSFGVLIFVVYVITFFTFKSPLKTIMIGLLAITSIFYLASIKNHFIADSMRAYINNIFDIDYLIGAVTVLALALAFATIYRERLKTKG